MPDNMGEDENDLNQVRLSLTQMLKELGDLTEIKESHQQTTEELGKIREALSQNEDIRKDLESKLAKHKDLFNKAQTEINQLKEDNAALREENAALAAPPQLFGTVLDVNDDKTVDILHESTRRRVLYHPSVNPDDIKRGMVALLAAKGLTVIKLLTDVQKIGFQASFVEMLDNGNALVEDGRGDKHAVFVAANIDSSSLEHGAPVLIDGNMLKQVMGDQQKRKALGAASVYALAEMPDATFDDIGGLDEAVREVISALEDPLKIPEGYKELRLKKTFSVLLAGQPGNGKTMIAKAIARHSFDQFKDKILPYAKGNFIAVGGTELYNKYLGETEKALRNIFSAAQKLHELSGAPVTVFFDDCESLFLSRNSEMANTNINGAVVGQFSTIVDGVRGLKGVNLIAATNRLDLMDFAVTRRFDAHVRINPPNTPEDAALVLAKQLRDVPIRDGAEKVIEELVRTIFAKGPENQILEIFFDDDAEDENTMTVRLCDLLSGKLLADIVQRAEVIAKDRIKILPVEERVWEITLNDLLLALERELRNKESLPTTKEAVKEWLRQRGEKRQVSSVDNLRAKRAIDKKRRERLDTQVQ